MAIEQEQDSDPPAKGRTVSLEEALAIAVAHQKEGDADTAEAIYRGILTAIPEHPDALQFLGILLHGRGESGEGVAMLRDAARHAPENAGIWTNLGNLLLGSGDADAAIEAYRRAVEIAPDYAAPYNNLGTIHRSRDELAEAEAAYRKAIELDPDFADSWHNLAVVMLSTERFDEAVECGLKAIALNPRHLFPLKLVGLAYARRGALDKAAGIFRAWLEKEPGSVLAQHHLAACEGRDVPARASDAYIETTFDGFAAGFDSKLSSLGYRAPGLVADAVRLARGADARGLRILDAGCGTGLCGHEVRPMAKQLVGVDLSGGMLEKAALTGAYDELERAELTAYLAAHQNGFDVVLSADTLCYFGALEAFAEAAFAALSPGGVLVFSVEAMPAGEANDSRLQPNGRYVHNGDYVDRALAVAGLRVERRISDVLRNELRVPVGGWIVTARRPSGSGT